MASERPLRGGCHCGRNSYVITIPANGNEIAQVIFDSDPRHRVFQGSPLAAFIRVPLTWYHSRTLAYFPDETTAVIRRTYTHPSQQSSMRQFCGFCGTPLAYWSEEPPGEAEFIRLTLGSLCDEDLDDLEDLGLVPSAGEGEENTEEDERMGLERKRKNLATGAAAGSVHTVILPDTDDSGGSGEREKGEGGGEEGGHYGKPLIACDTAGSVPWFDSMVAGSRLGKLRASRGGSQSQDGLVTYEWEVVEWTNEDDAHDNVAGGIQETTKGAPNPFKRLKQQE